MNLRHSFVAGLLWIVAIMPTSAMASPMSCAKDFDVPDNGRLLHKTQYRVYYVLQTYVRLRTPPYGCYCYGVSTSPVYPSSRVYTSFNSYGAAIARRNALSAGRGVCPNCRAAIGAPRQWRNRGYQVQRRRWRNRGYPARRAPSRPYGRSLATPGYRGGSLGQ